MPDFKIKLDARDRQSGLCTALKAKHDKLAEMAAFDERFLADVAQQSLADSAKDQDSTPCVTTEQESDQRVCSSEQAVKVTPPCDTAKFEICGGKAETELKGKARDPELKSNEGADEATLHNNKKENYHAADDSSDADDCTEDFFDVDQSV
jgi:hypothetical protein